MRLSTAAVCTLATLTAWESVSEASNRLQHQIPVQPPGASDAIANRQSSPAPTLIGAIASPEVLVGQVARLTNSVAVAAEPKQQVALQSHDTLTNPVNFAQVSSAQIKLAQQRLKARGFDPGSIDGVSGPKTEAAVAAFQQANHLQVDGIVGPHTWNALMMDDFTQLSASKVKQVQQKLQALGFNPGAIDGIWGAKTQAAVMAFQKARNLQVDGMVGPGTWKTLTLDPQASSQTSPQASSQPSPQPSPQAVGIDPVPTQPRATAQSQASPQPLPKPSVPAHRGLVKQAVKPGNMFPIFLGTGGVVALAIYFRWLYRYTNQHTNQPSQ